ncbi:MAG: hypothetical protein ABR912_16735, partial [Terracidiphilus sp.]
HYRPNPAKPPRHTLEVSTKKKWTLQEMESLSSQEGNSGRLRISRKEERFSWQCDGAIADLSGA